MASISFVIPCFNSEHFLPTCINSLVNQTSNDLEFIFIDDGSTDATSEIIENFINIEPRAKLIKKSNGGLTSARLTGIKNCTSNYVAFLDSDDYLDSGVAEEAISLLSKDCELDALIYNLVYLKDNVITCFDYKITFPCNGLEVLRNTIPSWSTSTIGVYRRSLALKAYSLIDFTAVNSDEVACRLIFCECQRVEKLKSRYFYVQTKSSLSRSVSINKVTRMKSVCWLRNYLFDYFPNKIEFKCVEELCINELCDLILLFNKNKTQMNSVQKRMWITRLKLFRRRVLSNLFNSIKHISIFSMIDLKFLKKIIFLFLWPLFAKGN